ncbi:MAG TPA: AAA family ATPase [Polyangiaceae bacterium]
MTINNYRSVRNASVSLGALTALVGPNASGKTTILRALNPVIQVTPDLVWRHTPNLTVSLGAVVDGKATQWELRVGQSVHWHGTRHQFLRLDLKRMPNQVANAPVLDERGSNLTNVFATLSARLRWLVRFLVLAALASVGCVPSTMRQGHEALVVSPARADAARVVFMRDDDAATHTNAGMAELHVVDGQGRLLGDLAIGTWFAVELPAGLHVFAAWHDGYGGTPYVAALAANLEERRTYFVRTVGRNRFDLDLVRGPLPILPQQTRSARRLDPAAASEWGARFRGRIDAAVRTAKAKLDAGEGASLQPGDGFLLETTAER